MTLGSIVEYIDQGRFICTVCLQDKGSRLHLLTPSNREVNLSPKRTLLVSTASLDIEQNREELLEKLQMAEEHRIKLKEQIDVKEIWELIHDEEEVFDHRYLAQLAFGEDATEDHFSAVMRALFENRLYFKMKNGFFLPNSEDRVKEIIRQEAEAAEKARRLEQGSAWLREVSLNHPVSPPECENDVISLLIQLALYGSDAEDYKYGREMLANAGIKDIRGARTLLTQLGVWEADEPVELIKCGVETDFSQIQLAESARLSSSWRISDGREDLRHLPAITIDGPDTQDYDDALSFEMGENELKIGIHIADVASIIPKDSPIDKAAENRASSLYLPRRQVPMMPHELSQDVLSLREGCDRPAISLLARFDQNGTLLDYRFTPSIICVKQQLTYDFVNHNRGDVEAFQQLQRIAEILRQNRMNHGAMSLSLPELEIHLDSTGALSLGLVPQDTPSRMIVAEFMILYNFLAAEFCKKNEIPILYRGQGAPSEKLPLDEKGYVFYVFQQRRKLSPLQISTTPSPHSGLGVDLYTQASSPIRRYLDLVIQRQLNGFLTEKACTYRDKELEDIRILVEPQVKTLARIQRNRTRYWTLKFLDMHKGKTFDALVLDELKSKYRILLNNFLMVADLKRQDGVILSKGQAISVKVKKADPWDDVIVLELAS